MSANKKGQRKNSPKGSIMKEPSFQFYGGISWKQIEYNSQYQYGYVQDDPEEESRGLYGSADAGVRYQLKMKSTLSS